MSDGGDAASAVSDGGVSAGAAASPAPCPMPACPQAPPPLGLRVRCRVSAGSGSSGSELRCRGLRRRAAARAPCPQAPPARHRLRVRAAALVDQRREAVGEVARQRLEQAGRLDQRRLERSGDQGQQLVARRQVGERPDVVGRQQLGAEGSALQHQQRVRPRRVAQRLGGAGDVALHERDRRSVRRAAPRARRRRPCGRRVGPGCSCTPCARHRSGAAPPRRRARWPTVKPRYSETNTASAVPSFDAISSTIATLSGLGLGAVTGSVTVLQ